MPTTAHTSQPDMREILNREISATLQLIETLTAERKSIIGADPAALEGAVHDKEQALLLIFHLEQQRLCLMETAGYSPDPDGMTLYMQQEQCRGEVSGLWQQLLAHAANCRDRNRDNHQLVEMYSHHTRQALCILRGEDPGQAVYGPAGITRDQHERQSLAKA